MLKHYNNILVTGGGGFIGSHLAEALVALKKKVVVLDNLSTGSKSNIPRNVKFIQGDIRKPKEVLKATKGIDLIFHLAANANGTVSVNKPRFDFETNALGTFNMLEAAARVGVKRFVYQSSASVYGTPQTCPMREDHPKEPFIPYGASKLTGEILCRSFHRTYNLPVVIARPFGVYGSRENPKLALVEVTRYLAWHLNGRRIQIVGNPNQKTRDFVHVSDVVQGLLLIADRGPIGEAFNIGTGGEISMQKLVEVIGSIAGRPAEFDANTEITQDTYRHVADISKLKALGYIPQVSIAKGIRRLAKALGDHPELPQGSTLFQKGQKGEGLLRI